MMQSNVIIFAFLLIHQFAAEFTVNSQNVITGHKHAMHKRQADVVLQNCQKPIEFGTVMQHARLSIEREKNTNEIAIGTQGNVYHAKAFVTAARITDQREMSKSRSNMREVKRETLGSNNWSSVQQEFLTSQMSLKTTVSRSVAIPSMTEVYGEIGLEIGGGINIPFVADTQISMSAKAGVKHTWGQTITNVVTEEVDTVIPRQTVKVPRETRVEMTWIFYSVEETIEYLIDLELDVDKTYIGLLEMTISRNANNIIDLVSFKRVRSCVLLRNLNNVPENELKPIGISIENGKYILKDFPIEVTVKSYHGSFQTEEEDLKIE